MAFEKHTMKHSFVITESCSNVFPGVQTTSDATMSSDKWPFYST